MRDLFVCSVGIKRSPFAASIAREFASKHKIQDYQADYCGIEGVILDKSAFEQYDRIFAMDSEIAKVLGRYVPESKLIKLNVSDQHSTTETRFREMLRKDIADQLEPYFKRLTVRK